MGEIETHEPQKMYTYRLDHVTARVGTHLFFSVVTFGICIPVLVYITLNIFAGLIISFFQIFLKLLFLFCQ